MTDVFIAVLNRAASASMIILAVMILRLILRGSPRWILRPLWGLAAIALVNFIPFVSIFSILPTAAVIPGDIVNDYTPKIDSGVDFIDSGVNGYLSSIATGSLDSVDPIETAFSVASMIWLAGIAVILIYGLVGYIRLRLSVRASIALEGNVYQCDDIDTPFILGAFKPRIYIPSGMEEKALEYVLLHERSHIKRGDHICKPFAFLILAFYWFDPLVWIAYVLFCRDVEVVCDSYAVDGMTPAGRRDYAETLAYFGRRRGFFAVSSLAFGEIAIKNRVKRVLRYDSADFWESAAAILILVAVAFLLIPTPFRNIDIYVNVVERRAYSYASERIDVPFKIERSAIPSDLLDADGGEHAFKKNEVISYKGKNTTIYLKKVYVQDMRFDEDEYIGFIFKISTDLPQDGGVFLSMYMPSYGKDSFESMFEDPYTWLVDVSDSQTTYPDALKYVGGGPAINEEITFVMPKSLFLSTEGDLSFVYDLEEVVYEQK